MISRSASASALDWCKWIDNDDNNNTIDGDSDGVFTQPNRILCDISQALSQRLGRQMSQMATYVVDYISVHLRNKDDLNDNDAGLEINGGIHFWGPSKHRINALQMARQLETNIESVSYDADSFVLSTEKDYSGLRFNWDADGQVKYATSEGFGELAGTEWDMAELFQVYGNMQGDSSQYQNALWNQGRGGYPNQIGFSTSYTNQTNQGLDETFDPKSQVFTFDKPVEVLGGLLMLDITHSSTGVPFQTIDDDYEIVVTLGVKGWSDF